MGAMCCGAETPASYQNRLISRHLDSARRDTTDEKKLLLLGAGGSGKSTLFRQLKILDNGLSEDERRAFQSVVFMNIINAIQILVKYNYEFAAEEKDFELGNNAALSADIIRNINDDEITIAIAEHIKILWEEPGIQKTWRHRSMFQIQDSAKYYFENIDRIAEEAESTTGYIPSEHDVIRCRAKTTGIIERVFTIKSTRLRIVDVGGQRNERRKWFHCFQEVDAVIFVCALSAYDQTIFEDEETNRMQESLQLFQIINSSEYFQEAAMILFLNKNDLFVEKIGAEYSENPLKVPLSVCFPECPKHENPYEDGLKYIKNKFQRLIGQRKRSDLYIHVTCATDKGNIRKVFNNVQNQILKRALTKASLI